MIAVRTATDLAGTMAYERKDRAYRQAKREGFRSRAAYKLDELDDDFHILAEGKKIIDLGCWPGAWLQVAAKRVGPRGVVVGIDRVDTTPLGRDNVVLITGDVRDASTVERVLELLGGPADVVLSDLAPKLTGVRITDTARQSELVEAALVYAQATLRPGGSLLAKLFMNADYPSLIARIRSSFREVRARRPDSTRSGSAEIYVCAKWFLGGPRFPDAGT